MARIRTIKPEYWTDSLMVQLPHLARLVYIALWNEADDYGCLPHEVERLAMQIMPRELFTDVDAVIQLLEAAGRLELHGTKDGELYFQIAHWSDHQRVDHPGKSRLLREDSRKIAIPLSVRREVALKYGCEPGGERAAECFYCGRPGRVHWVRLQDGRPSAWVVFPDLELEHIVAENSGGENVSENIVLACRACNRSKGTAPWCEFMLSRSLAKPLDPSTVLAVDQGSGKGKDQGKEKKTSSNGGNGAHAKTKKSQKPAMFPFPEDFSLDEELTAYAVQRLPDVDTVALLEAFRGDALKFARMYADWRQAFQGWVRNSMPQSKHFAANQYPRKSGGIQWQ